MDDAKPGAGLGIGLADVDVFDFKRHILGVSRMCSCIGCLLRTHLLTIELFALQLDLGAIRRLAKPALATAFMITVQSSRQVRRRRPAIVVNCFLSLCVGASR